MPQKLMKVYVMIHMGWNSGKWFEKLHCLQCWTLKIDACCHCGSNPILVLVYCFIWVGCEKFSFGCNCNFVKLNEVCKSVKFNFFGKFPSLGGCVFGSFFIVIGVVLDRIVLGVHECVRVFCVYECAEFVGVYECARRRCSWEVCNFKCLGLPTF